MATTNYNAGIDSSDLEISLGREAVWGTIPATTFQAFRILSESLSEAKTRDRPAEIEPGGFAAHGITTQVEAAGDLSFALSATTFDDFFEGLVNGTWGTPVAIDGAAGDVSAVLATSKFAAGAGKFTGVVVGQWLRVEGFASGTNSGTHRVIAVAGGGEDITVASTLVDETPAGTDAKFRGTILRNGVDFHSYHIQKKLAAALFLNYAGAYITGGSLSASVGDFVQGSVSMLAASETNNTSDQSTGGVLATPTNTVIDTVGGFQALQFDDVLETGVVQSIDFAVQKNNARGQYGVGSAAAQGMGRGTIMVDGNMSIYFNDFTLYTEYKNETDKSVAFNLIDSTTGEGYVFTMPQVTLINPSVQAGGPDTDVLATFTLEASQDPVTNCTIQIDAFPATGV
jgi:hypothetical protein